MSYHWLVFIPQIYQSDQFKENDSNDDNLCWIFKVDEQMNQSYLFFHSWPFGGEGLSFPS